MRDVYLIFLSYLDLRRIYNVPRVSATYVLRTCYVRFVAVTYVWRTRSIYGVLRVSIRFFAFMLIIIIKTNFGLICIKNHGYATDTPQIRMERSGYVVDTSRVRFIRHVHTSHVSNTYTLIRSTYESEIYVTDTPQERYRNVTRTWYIRRMNKIRLRLGVSKFS